MITLKKLLLGTVVASTMLFSLPAQEAQAATATLAKKFYYELNVPPSPGTIWDYMPIDSSTNPYLTSTSNHDNIAISYLQFQIDEAVTNVEGALGLFLHDVSTSPNNQEGLLSIYRVDDNAVFNASGDLDVSSVGLIAPISLGSWLDTITVNDANDNDPVSFDFAPLISSAVVNGSNYLSFAIVADITGQTEWVQVEQDPTTVTLTVDTPVPEPMSAAYMLVGAGAFALRRIKRLLGLA